MIRPYYTLKLAHTKLKSKRVMLWTSIIISSLLFAVLIAGIVIFTGAEKSASTLLRESNDGKYLVKVDPVMPMGIVHFGTSISLDLIKEMREFEREYYAKEKQKYKEMDLEYNEKMQESMLRPNPYAAKDVAEVQRYLPNYNTKVMMAFTEQRLKEYLKTAPNTATNLKALVKQYNAEGVYKMTQLPMTNADMVFLENGEEDYAAIGEDKQAGVTMYDMAVGAIKASMYTMQDNATLTRFIGDNPPKELKGIPVIASAQELAKLYGKKHGIAQKEPADERAKLQWLRDIKKKIVGTTYQVCYRNAGEQAMFAKLRTDYANIKVNEGDKNYIKPSLIYDVPKEACGDIQIKSDTRTAAEKKAEQKSIEIQKKLGRYIEPAHKLLTFQIMGVMKPVPYGDKPTDITSYVRQLMSVNNDIVSAMIPAQWYDKLDGNQKDLINGLQVTHPILKDMNDDLDISPRIVAFTKIDDARKFLSDESCPLLTDSGSCKKLYQASPHGSNYLILEDIGKLFKKLMTYTLPAVLGLAVIIIWFTMARVMAENRQETAVYRSMGAKRSDIAAIYLTYSMAVALRIALLSLFIGVAGAFAVDYFYGTQLTATALTTLGMTSTTLRFSLFDLTSPYLFMVIGTIFIVSLIAIIQPLIRNVMRSPIEDVRSN